MKKKIALLLGMVLAVSALAAGCGDTKAKDDNTEKSTEDGQKDTAAEGELLTGVAMETSIGSSEDGKAQADIMIAAVTVDADGKIVDCVIDSVQSKIEFDAEGKLTTDAATKVPSKNELGEDYGMVAYGNATAEWNEQAAAFAEFCIGKTADEVTGMEVTEDGKAADADLAATCTIHVGGFQSVVAKAVKNAENLGAQAGDKLGLGIDTNIAKSADATADADGVAETYTTVSAVTVDADGKITSAVIDAVQADVKFDTTGKITSDLAAPIATKDELGEDYGMVAYGNAIAEWDEQAAAYAAYCVGKTADEVNATAVTEGVPSDADLAASVTIHIGDFNLVITKAVDSAK